MQTPNLFVVGLGLLFVPNGTIAQTNHVKPVAPGVYFHEGDLAGKGHCNNGWVIFEDYVLVIDANFPSGATEIIPKIRALTDKPIRFAFDTHHHGDHAYGNQVWADHGAVPVAHSHVIEEMKKYETGHYGGPPGRWEQEAEKRADVAQSKLKPPTLLFNHDLIFDDGNQRVELLYFGVAHTHGDGFAWMPKQRILFTGDAIVNGPYNYVGDGNVTEWIDTLEKVKTLNPAMVCPGHGPIGGPNLIDDQQSYFKTLRAEIKKRMDSGKTGPEIQGATEEIKAAIQKNPSIARYAGDFFPAQVEKVYVEYGGKPFPAVETNREARLHHDHTHGKIAAKAP